MIRIKLKELRRARPETDSSKLALIKVGVFDGAAFMFDAYLYEEGDWWCTAGPTRRVFPAKGGGFTWNVNVYDLMAFAREHAARLARPEPTNGSLQPNPVSV